MGYRILILLFLVIRSSPLWARFDPVDALWIDPEEKNNTETWNDKNSYRYPVPWTREWMRAEMGYRVNAGSLNVSRFNFEDDVPSLHAVAKRTVSMTKREDCLISIAPVVFRIGHYLS